MRVRPKQYAGWLTTDRFQTPCYMGALAVLYRSILKSPSRLSSRADLEHLRAVRIHLQRDDLQSNFSPSLRALFNNMVKSAEELVWKQS